MNTKQQATLKAIVDMFPEITSSGVIERKYIVSFVKNTSSSWPTFITNQTPISRGVYPIPGSSSNNPQMIIQSNDSKEQKAINRRKAIQAASGMVKGSTNEPTISAMNYKIDLIKALNYYNVAYDYKDKAKWVLSYVDSSKKQVLSRIPDYEFHAVGSLVRLKARNEFLEDRELLKIESELDRLYTIGQSIAINDKPKQTKIISNKQQDEAIRIAGEFEGLIDDFIVSNKVPDFADYLKSISAPSSVVSLIPEQFKSIIDELQIAVDGDDSDLKEGYSNLGKAKLRKLLGIYQSIADACTQQKVVIRIAPRKKRDIPVSKLVAKVKYQKEIVDLNIISELPSKLIGATEVWLYNTKYRRLQVYKVAEPNKISVKGTALIGWDPEISSSKAIRKPDTIKTIQTMGKRDSMKLYQSLSSKTSSVNGRLNENTVILKIFS